MNNIPQPTPLTDEQRAVLTAHEQAVAARDAAYTVYADLSKAADKAGYAAISSYDRIKYLAEYPAFIARATSPGQTLITSGEHIGYLVGGSPRRRDAVLLRYDGKVTTFTAYKQNDSGIWGERLSGGTLWRVVE